MKKAADLGHQEAAYWYAYLSDLGEHEDARIYYKKAADLGHVEASCWYGWFCHIGKYGPCDLGSAKTYFEKAAEKGHEGASEMLKRMQPRECVIEMPLILAKHPSDSLLPT